MENLIKIIYQSGEFSEANSSILGVSIDTIFTVLTTLFIFFVGYYVNNKIKLQNENKRLREVEEYFITLVELLEEPLKRQKEALIEFTAKLQEKVVQHHNLGVVASFRVDLIKEIDNMDLYNIFVKSKKGEIEIKTKLFNKISQKVDYLFEIRKSIKDIFEEYVQKLNRHENIYKENLKITSDAFDEMLLQSIQPNQDPFLIEFDRIRVEWVNSGNKEITYQDRYITREYYINPVMSLCRKFVGDPRAIHIFKHSLECIFALDNIEEVKNVYGGYFLRDAMEIESAMVEIKKSLKVFANM